MSRYRKCWPLEGDNAFDALKIKVINAVTGELLRDLILDPDRGYQPRFKK